MIHPSLPNKAINNGSACFRPVFEQDRLISSTQKHFRAETQNESYFGRGQIQQLLNHSKTHLTIQVKSNQVKKLCRVLAWPLSKYFPAMEKTCKREPTGRTRGGAAPKGD